MRLICNDNWHDYYDCMARYDEDREIIFNRKTSIKTRPDKYTVYGVHLNQYDLYARHGVMWIGFCGKLYMGLNIYEKDKLVDIWWDKKRINEQFRLRNEASKYRWRRKSKPITYDELVAKYKEVYPVEDESIWASVKHSEVIINPCLKNYLFYTIMPPQQAWIELSAYHNNIARPLRPVPDVSNSDLIQAKGYDLKTSFRKEKSSPKKRSK